MPDDLISRAEALKVIENEKMGWYGTERYAIDECHSRIQELPSVVPKQKEGKWITQYNSDSEEWLECSECKFEVGARQYYNFCPACGSYNGGKNNNE